MRLNASKYRPVETTGYPRTANGSIIFDVKDTRQERLKKEKGKK